MIQSSFGPIPNKELKMGKTKCFSRIWVSGYFWVCILYMFIVVYCNYQATYLTCLLRNLYAGQEAIVRTGHGTTHWFQTGKGVRQGCILSPCLFNLYAEYIMRNAGLEKHSWNQDYREKYQ